jgi:hypothetical protein
MAKATNVNMAKIDRIDLINLIEQTEAHKWSEQSIPFFRSANPLISFSPFKGGHLQVPQYGLAPFYRSNLNS